MFLENNLRRHHCRSLKRSERYEDLHGKGGSTKQKMVGIRLLSCLLVDSLTHRGADNFNVPPSSSVLRSESIQVSSPFHHVSPFKILKGLKFKHGPQINTGSRFDCKMQDERAQQKIEGTHCCWSPTDFRNFGKQSPKGIPYIQIADVSLYLARFGWALVRDSGIKVSPEKSLSTNFC